MPRACDDATGTSTNGGGEKTGSVEEKEILKMTQPVSATAPW